MGESRLAEALDYFRQAQKLQEDLITKAPNSNVVHSNLATTHRYVGDLLLGRRGDCGGAREAYQRSIDIYETLLEKDPSNSTWLVVLVPTYLSVGDIYRRLGQPAEARIRYQRAVDGAQKLINRDPDRAEWKKRLNESQERLGRLDAPLGPDDQCRGP